MLQCCDNRVNKNDDIVHEIIIYVNTIVSLIMLLFAIIFSRFYIYSEFLFFYMQKKM